MFENGSFHLNIRQKVILALAVSLLVVGSVGGISYHYLEEVERKQHFVEFADDLSNIILEIRRYEKNYLLYGSEDDLAENHKYIEQGLEILIKIVPEVKNLEGAPQLSYLGEEFQTYDRLMQQMAQARREGKHTVPPRIEEELRDRGKALVEVSQHLVTFERQRILKIVRALKTQLQVSLGVLLTIGGFLVVIVANKIVRPLRVIERTTLRIAQGDFQPIPVRDTRDETQRVVEALNFMVAELEKRQDQLLQAKKLSSLGILASGIAHQLNNPLNNISTSCQILLEELEEADHDFLKRMLTNVEGEVHRARDIVRGLLEFSRVKEFCLTPSYLSQVVERAVRLISSQVPPGIDIISDIPDDLMLDVDPPRMQQVFLNLFMNAIQAIQNPPGQIRISAHLDEGAQEAVVCIEDTGVGIPQKDLSRVFDPFFTTKEVGVGTGLGLSIVYGTIQKHQGSIAVESREGEGTRFHIRLPLHCRT